MTKSTKEKLAYQAAYNKAHADDQVARRRASRHAIARGTQRIGDGIDLDHKKPLNAGGSTADSNVRPKSPAENRAWRKDKPEMYGKKK